MQEEIKKRFKFDKTHSISIDEKNQIEAHALAYVLEPKMTLVFTSGLSNFQMEVPKGLESKSQAELILLLDEAFNPETWEYRGMDVQLVLKKIASLVTEKKSWIGAGHTFPNVSEEPTISIYTEMDHFMLIEPVLLEEQLKALKNGEQEITFLAIIPLFKKELEYKMKNGAYSLMKRLKKNSISEYFEMKRPVVLKRKFFGL